MIFSSIVGATDNLLKNGNFSSHADGKLANWVISAAETESVTVDNVIAGSGKTALKICHKSSDSYSYVRQLINVVPDTKYLLTARIRTEGIAVALEGLGARAFVGDETGRTVSPGSMHAGTMQWQDIRMEFSAGSRSQLQLYLYLHKSSGTVWFADVTLTKVEQQAVELTKGTPLGLRGTIYSSVYYAPESSLVTSNFLQMYGILNLGKASFYLYTCYEGKNIGFEQQPSRNFTPYINYVVLKLDGKLHPTMQSCTTTLGYARINYSPYVATINKDYAMKCQGISVENIKWKQYDLSAFNLFEVDSRKRYSSIGQGMRFRGGLGPWKGEVIVVRHLNGNHIVDGNGNIIALDTYLCDEFNLLYNFQRQFNNGTKISFLRAEQNKKDTQTLQAIAQKIDWDFPLGRFKSTISFRSFEPGFTPRYRDKTPRVVSGWSETLLAMNPVDRYRNQRGFSLETMGSLWGKQFNMLMDFYSLLPEGKVRKTNLFANLKGPLILGLIFTWDEKFSSLYSEISFRRELANNNKIRVSGEVLYIEDATGRNNDLELMGKVHEFALSTTVKTGFFAGINFQTGIQRAERQNYYYLRSKVALFGIVELIFACRTPQIDEQTTEYWFDDFDRLHFRDQYLRLKTSVSF